MTNHKKGRPEQTRTASRNDTVNIPQSDAARQLKADLDLWTDVIALMASTYTMAAKLEGKEVNPEQIMNAAAEFANVFMAKRAELLGGAR
jgi:hypothetical protein